MFIAALAFLQARSPESAAEALIEGRRLRDKHSWRRAERRFRKALILARRDGDKLREAEALHLLSGFRLIGRRTAEARRLATEAAQIYRELGEVGAAAQAMRLAQTAGAMGRA